MSLFENFISYLKNTQNIKPIIISLLTMMPVTALVTYLVIDNMVIKGKASRIEELTYDKSFLSSQLASIQSQLEKQTNTENSRIESRLATVKTLYDENLSENKNIINQLTSERNDLVSQLAKCNNSEKLWLYNVNKENQEQLRQELSSVQKNINTLYLEHSRLSSEYGYSATECEKRGSSYHSNICELSSKSKAQLDSLNEQIRSQEQRRQFIQNEILLLQGDKNSTTGVK